MQSLILIILPMQWTSADDMFVDGIKTIISGVVKFYLAAG